MRQLAEFAYLMGSISVLSIGLLSCLLVWDPDILNAQSGIPRKISVSALTGSLVAALLLYNFCPSFLVEELKSRL